MRKIGLSVMRAQPFHNGHLALITKMLSSMDLVLIGLGSSQESGTIQNPFTYLQRAEMIRRIFGDSDKVKIFPISDLGGDSAIAWVDHVMKSATKHYPKPTHYFAGTRFDSCWYEVYSRDSGDLEIVILDRLKDPVRATEIRKMMLIQDALPEYGEAWKEFVPEIIQNYVEESFPREELPFKL